ncbi:MAG: hypothetical protein WCT12_25915 [Verrucomicrobiota bacterium]
MKAEEYSKSITKLALLLILGVIMIGVAWLMTRPNGDKQKLHRQRQEFFALTGAQLLGQEEQRNRDAIERAKGQLATHVSDYRKGVPKFAEDLTTWGTRYAIAAASVRDWWSSSNEARKVATEQFAKFVVSDKTLQQDVTGVIAQFSPDLEANRNTMLSELQEKASTAAVPCASTEMGSTNIAGAFMLEVQPLIKARATQSPIIGVLATGGGFFVGEAATQIVTRLLTSMAARVASGAAVRGSAVAAGVLVGGEGGTVLAPGVGTAIGITGGIIVGCAVDWWMEKRFKEKVTGECNQILADMEKALWADASQGLEGTFTRAIKTTRECHEIALRKIITGDTK